MSSPMTLNKKVLRVPQKMNRDWKLSVMHVCDYCGGYRATLPDGEGGSICPTCCDSRYASDLKSVFELALEQLVAAEKRIAELEARTVKLPTPYPKGYGLAADKYNFALEECADAIRAAGVAVEGKI
ncbi:hypothetical protein Q0A17_06420 [Citrobacter sp. S2-9]|uniref:Ead/Ea22-like family protein n=1 Tax=Citrobacter enshiensis TaxID=2971264 RepID=A0ABT8PRZ7_9ENTR|nr:hypothetical protein [Citrobacter enshiensis]MDN8599049.1 hypothetical protein [Citrobacter enshiensis]